MLKQSEVVEMLAERLEVSKSQAESFLKSYTEILSEDLVNTGKTKINKIGTLEVRYRAPRNGVNPRTREQIEIAESLTVGLSASQLIKDELKNKVDIAKYRK